jgi:hypothetical protein
MLIGLTTGAHDIQSLFFRMEIPRACGTLGPNLGGETPSGPTPARRTVRNLEEGEASGFGRVRSGVLLVFFLGFRLVHTSLTTKGTLDLFKGSVIGQR